jgi:hypothetical protein
LFLRRAQSNSSGCSGLGWQRLERLGAATILAILASALDLSADTMGQRRCDDHFCDRDVTDGTLEEIASANRDHHTDAGDRLHHRLGNLDALTQSLAISFNSQS